MNHIKNLHDSIELKHDNKMAISLAIGIGCRLACTGSAIAALVETALARVPAGTQAQKALFTIAHKRGHPGPAEAARLLGLELHFLPAEALQAAMPRVQTGSARALALFGVASVAEAAALAGAGAKASLLVTRIAANGATCAIAACADPAETAS